MSLAHVTMPQKINQKNTWSLNLIDHIENLIEEDSAASTMGPDFQKASCTLDASIKIYSYRVDDVWNSSFRVLENLNRTDSDRQSEFGRSRGRIACACLLSSLPHCLRWGCARP